MESSAPETGDVVERMFKSRANFRKAPPRGCCSTCYYLRMTDSELTCRKVRDMLVTADSLCDEYKITYRLGH